MSFVVMIDELRDTTGRESKEEILRYHLEESIHGDFNKFLLRECFDPNLLHHVVLKKSDIPSDTGTHELEELSVLLYSLFGGLHDELSPAKNKKSIQAAMVMLHREDQEALLAVVNKKLKCGISIKTLNKVLPDFIEVVPIGLAKSYKPGDEHKYSNYLYSSYKLDGQRVFCIRDHDRWRKYSRAGDYLGNEIKTLNHWDEELEHYYEDKGVNFLDGEAYKHGLRFEDITRLVRSSVNKKDASQLEYHIFFAGKTRDLKESARSNSIAGINPGTLHNVFNRYQYLVGVKQHYMIANEENIYEQIDAAVELGYEGVVLRSADVWYEFKRGNNLLKAKKSELSGVIDYADCYVEDIEYGEMAIRENNQETTENLPVALWVCIIDDPSTRLMKVGSGFSLAQRREWANEEALVVGQIIEVEYQGMGSKGSMRFPRYLRTRTDL